MLGQAPPTINIPTKRMIDVELHIEENDFTMKEIQIVIKNLKNNKASRIDNIRTEIWKAGICSGKLLQGYDQKRKLFRTNSFVLAHSSAKKIYIEQLTVKSSIQ